MKYLKSNSTYKYFRSNVNVTTMNVNYILKHFYEEKITTTNVNKMIKHYNIMKP